MSHRTIVTQATMRLMRYGNKAVTARVSDDLVTYWDLRTSTDDCRIALRAAAAETVQSWMTGDE
jgi:hypothetical protein